jgi:uroporphyrinogen decarboxylase
VPLAVFPRGAHHALEVLADSDFDVVSVDWTIAPQEARRRAGPDITLQGNLDPALLYADPDVIRRETQNMVDAFGSRRYIANLGHGMMPDHDPSAAAEFVDSVRISHPTREP